MMGNALQEIKTRIALFGVEDDGMSTAEYSAVRVYTQLT